MPIPLKLDYVMERLRTDDERERLAPSDSAPGAEAADRPPVPQAQAPVLS